jgi:hypothetical protein
MTDMEVKKRGVPGRQKPMWTGFADDGLYSGKLPSTMAGAIKGLIGFKAHKLRLAEKPGAVGFVKRDGV